MTIPKQNAAPASLTAAPSPKPAPAVRLASGRLAKLRKGEAITPAHYNALVEDLESIAKRIGLVETEKGKPAKAG